MVKFLVIFFTFFLQSCSSDVIEFFSHKKKMEENYGPCEWIYVGVDTQINNPAIKIKPQFGEEYVLWNQRCERL